MLMQKAARWPCGVCARGAGSNSIQCSSRQKWVHKKCSGSMNKVMKSLICRGCLNPVTNTVHASVDIGASANLELMDKFCNLDDMLSVDEDVDAAVKARIRTVWNKFRQSIPLLTSMDRGMLTRGPVHLHDNALAHTSCAAQDIVKDIGFQQLLRPPYSPDLASSDFYLSEETPSWYKVL